MLRLSEVLEIVIISIVEQIIINERFIIVMIIMIILMMVNSVNDVRCGGRNNLLYSQSPATISSSWIIERIAKLDLDSLVWRSLGARSALVEWPGVEGLWILTNLEEARPWLLGLEVCGVRRMVGGPGELARKRTLILRRRIVVSSLSWVSCLQ